MYKASQVAELFSVSESSVLAAVETLGYDSDKITDAEAEKIYAMVKPGNLAVKTDSGKVISPVSKAPAKRAASDQIVPTQVDAGAIAPVQPAGDVAPANPTTIAKIAPPPSVQDALVSRLQSQFEQGAAIARLEVEAMAAGHDATLAHGMSALLNRNVNPFANLGEIELPKVDWDAPYQLPNPFAEVNS